jgi:putative ABC transport system permease protein
VLHNAFQSSNRDVVFTAQDLAPFLLGDRLRVLQWFGITAGIFFLIANANAAGIWLAQWRRYERQVSIQLSLGAPVWRIFTDQLAQTAILAVAATAIGLIGVKLLLTGLRYSSLLGPELNRLELWSKAGLDAFTVVAALAATIFASIVAASLPLLLTRWNSLHEAMLINPGTGTGRSSSKLRVALAITQLTLTAVLSYAGILVAHNIHSLLTSRRGFRTEQILQAGIGVSESRYNTDELMIDFHQQVIEELRHVPGVIEAAGGADMPVSNTRPRFLLDDQMISRDRQPTVRLGVASPRLLPMLGVQLLRGRMFGDTDRWQKPHVALVNEAFEAKYLRGGNPIGHGIRISFYNGFAAKPYGRYTIVGVIANTQNRYFLEKPDPEIVISSSQIALEGFRYFVSTSLPASALEDGVHKAIWKVNPEVQRIHLTPLAAYLGRALVTRRTVATLAGWFAALAILVVGFGVSASLSATFQEQLRDLGIRAALGATGPRLAYESVKWGAISIAVSWALALPLSFAVSNKLVLDGVRLSWDLESWVGVGLVLGLVGFAAAYLPARRSARLDPATVLRSN